LDPCIPKGWDGYQVTRLFRGAKYRISVKNPKHVSRGVSELKVNGQKVEGQLLPLAERGTEVNVEVTLG
jgi:cellobiose phosphorylase